MSKNRFDLEEDIMRCWEIVDDLETIGESDLTVEEYRSIIDSLHTLYSLKFKKLFSTFEQCIESKEFE